MTSVSGCLVNLLFFFADLLPQGFYGSRAQPLLGGLQFEDLGEGFGFRTYPAMIGVPHV